MAAAQPDVVVAGGTAAGVAASVAAARGGAEVLLVEASPHLGGLMTSGLGRTDIGARTTIGGLFRVLVNRIREHYVETYGAGSPQAEACGDGYEFEPSVAERCLEALLAGHAGITVWRGWRLAWENGRRLVETAPGAGPEAPDGQPQRRVVAVTFERVDGNRNATGERRRVEAAVFVDATYEGDVALGAGAAYRIGRESREEFGESHAGVLYQDFRTKLCYPPSTGAADRRIQAYNYRLCLTRDQANRLPVRRPDGYDRATYAPLVDDVLSGRVRSFMGWGSTGVLNQAALPNAKTDCNNHHYSFLSTDWPEENFDYPEAGPERRREIAAAHRAYTEGLLWFCQHDPQLPAWFRAEALEWGYAADEFTDNGGFPRQMYVREAARIAGEYVFTSHDATRSPAGGRAPIHWDSIAAGGYAIDSHATRRREDAGLRAPAPEERLAAAHAPLPAASAAGNGTHAVPGAAADGRVYGLEGFLSLGRVTVPYQLPYRIMLPLGIDGLLVPVAVSATHLGFATIRMEPTWIALGEAAGTAAALAVREGSRVRDVPRAALQRTLVEHGQVITYLADVTPPGFPGYETQPPGLFAAVQFLGTRGFFPTYRVQPDAPLTQGEARRWIWLVARAFDPWRRSDVDDAGFEESLPCSETDFLEWLRAAVAEPSPLRQSLGVPLPPPPPDRPDGPIGQITRGDACRVLYSTYAPHL